MVSLQSLFELNNWRLSVEDESRPAGSAVPFMSDGFARGIHFSNPTSGRASFSFCGEVLAANAPDEPISGCRIVTSGKAIGGTGSLMVNGCTLPLNGEAWIPVAPGEPLLLSFECGAKSSIVLEGCEMEWLAEEPDLTTRCSDEPNVLIVAPDYPTDANLYLCAFAHIRNRFYSKSGMRLQVLALSPERLHKTVYTIDGINVLSGNSLDFEALLMRKQYDVIVTHFVDMHHYRLFDACVTYEQLVFIVHGPLETMYPLSPIIARPYFTQPPSQVFLDQEKKSVVGRYARKDNVSWVFVSDWQRKKSEELMGVEFANSQVIHNYIDSDRFRFRQKTPDDRKRILVLRRFDNTIFHSIDIVVRCIWELSRRDFFSDLHFEIVGDGSMFKELTAPLERFDNVDIARTFVPNERIPELHARNGIMLMPSRHDSHPVSMSEGASSGLVPVGSQVTSLPFFFDDDRNHVLAPAEDPVALADVIERLYRNPDEYLAISERVAERTQMLCNAKETVGREVELIAALQRKAALAKHACAEPVAGQCALGGGVEHAASPVLTIAIVAYNGASLLDRCLRTILNRTCGDGIEVLVPDAILDGEGLQVLDDYMVAYPRSVVRLRCGSGVSAGELIMCSVDEARGKYVHFLQASSWAYSESLSALIDALANSDVDLVLTDEMILDPGKLMPRRALPIDGLQDRSYYPFELMAYPYYGLGDQDLGAFAAYYRTRCVSGYSLPISGSIGQALFEAEALFLSAIQTVGYFRITSFWDFSNRMVANEVDSPDDYYSIRQMVVGVVEFIKTNRHSISSGLIRFLARTKLAPIIASAIEGCDQKLQWGQLEVLENDFEDVADLWAEMLDDVRERSWNAYCVLGTYKEAIAVHSERPLVDFDGSFRPVEAGPGRGARDVARSLIRGMVPVGIIETRRAWKEAAEQNS